MKRNNRRSPFFDNVDTFGFGFDFDEIFKEMELMMSQMKEDPEYASGKPMYYGYSLEVGPDGKPHFREYGNAKMRPSGVDKMISEDEKSQDNTTVESSCGCAPQINYEPVKSEDGEDIIEPYTCTIFNEKKNQLMINAEVPGISKKDIDLELTGDDLVLTAKNDLKYYRKTIHLDQEVSKRTIKANYNNGVLEITLKCKKPGQKQKSKKIDIK